MVMEIEKMTSIQEKVTDAEAREIGLIIDTLSKDFEGMVHDSRVFILTGKKVERDFADSISALQKLKNYGERFGVEFPDIKSNDQASTYILTFGRETVLMDRK